MKETDLHDYQLTTKEYIVNKTHCGIFLEMGLGKTVSTLTAVKYLMFEELEIRKVLVIAPKRVAENVWDDEILKWDHLKCLTISKIAGSEKQRRQALAAKADIYTIGRDNVAWLCGLYGGMMLPFDMLVIDELSSFKNPKSVRFRALRKVQPSFKRIVGLTGTPAPNGLIDLWSQIYLLDRGERLGKFIGNFRDEYFRPGKRNGAIIYSYNLIEEGEKRIHEKISDICISMKAKDYLKLPGRIENIIKINFPKELQTKYDDFEKSQVLQLAEKSRQESGELDFDKVISATNAAALFNKLLQFANGAVYDENGVFHELHELKIEAVKEIIDTANGKPVLIAWTYRHDMIRLKKALAKLKPRELDNKKDIDDWNAGKIQVLLMHPASGGHGLNIQAGGHIIIWYGQTCSVELLLQFNARLDRQGQREVVVINKLVACHTIDEEVIQIQDRKVSKQEALMLAVKARVKKYLHFLEK